MLPNFSEAKKRFAARSAAKAESQRRELQASANNNLVKVVWDVTYDPVGHDIIIEAKIKIASSSDDLLQVWLKNGSSGIGIPELLPWVASVAEFTEDQHVKEAHLGLLDSKWRPEDAGAEYIAEVFGYVMHDGKVEGFFDSKGYVFEG